MYSAGQGLTYLGSQNRGLPNIYTEVVDHRKKGSDISLENNLNEVLGTDFQEK